MNVCCFYLRNLCIYQASEVLPRPSRVSVSPVSAENIIYQTFFLSEKLAGASFTAFLEERGKYRKARRTMNGLVFTFFFSVEAMKRNSILVIHQNKGFINYIFCRNWGVRNPAGTRLDTSSLVNKQVATYETWQDMGFILWPLRWKMSIPQTNKSMMTTCFLPFPYNCLEKIVLVDVFIILFKNCRLSKIQKHEEKYFSITPHDVFSLLISLYCSITLKKNITGPNLFIISQFKLMFPLLHLMATNWEHLIRK